MTSTSVRPARHSSGIWGSILFHIAIVGLATWMFFRSGVPNISVRAGIWAVLGIAVAIYNIRTVSRMREGTARAQMRVAMSALSAAALLLAASAIKNSPGPDIYLYVALGVLFVGMIAAGLALKAQRAQ